MQWQVSCQKPTNPSLEKCPAGRPLTRGKTETKSMLITIAIAKRNLNCQSPEDGIWFPRLLNSEIFFHVLDFCRTRRRRGEIILLGLLKYKFVIPRCWGTSSPFQCSEGVLIPSRTFSEWITVSDRMQECLTLLNKKSCTKTL